MLKGKSHSSAVGVKE